MELLQFVFHRPLKGFLYTVPVQQLYWKKTVDAADFVRLAKSIYDTHLAGRPFTEVLQTYLDCCRTLDDIGLAKYKSKTYFLIAHLAARIGLDGGLNRDQLTSIEYLAEQTKNGGHLVVWYHPKLTYLALYVRDRIQVEEYFNGVKCRTNVDNLLEALEHATGSNLEGISGQLSASLHEQRKYGVKPAFFQDGVLHRPDQAWVVLDNRSITESLEKGDLHSFENKVCRICLAQRKTITSLKAHTTSGTIDGSQLTKIEFGVKAYLNLSLDREGHLFTGGLADMSVQEIAKRCGKEAEYEFLRLANLYRVYNLVVPIEVARQVPALPDPGSTIKNLVPGTVGGRIKRLLDPNLLIPRLKSLEDTRSLFSQLAEEVEKAEKETAERAKRQMVEHDVIGHARKLLPGHHASARSIANASKDGVTLAPDETYVALHTRGKGGEKQKPHKAVIR